MLIKHRNAVMLAATMLSLSVGSATAHGPANDGKGYAYGTAGVIEIPGIKVLLDESNLGGKELEIAEITFPAGTVVEGHKHDSLEVFYVLSGTLGHEVNGELHMLTPGMVGVVRVGDTVRHIIPKESDTKVLVIWAPAGEARRIFDFTKGKPIEQK